MTTKTADVAEREWGEFLAAWSRWCARRFPETSKEREGWESFVNAHSVALIERCLERWSKRGHKRGPSLGWMVREYRALLASKPVCVEKRAPVVGVCERCGDSGWAYGVTEGRLVRQVCAKCNAGRSRYMAMIGGIDDSDGWFAAFQAWPRVGEDLEAAGQWSGEALEAAGWDVGRAEEDGGRRTEGGEGQRRRG